MRRFLTLLSVLIASISLLSATTLVEQLPKKIYSDKWKAGHIQGIAVDSNREYIYYSFTTMLVKADMQGNIIGTVTGLLGHLGCIEFNDADGRLYGSLEYKNDSIGRGILKQEKSSKQWETAFYVAIFDVNKITHHNMNAEQDGIMTTVCLNTVVEDYEAKVSVEDKLLEHRFGCSGFDGITFGPKFGSKGGKHYLTIAYGIYDDTTRPDNDHQVLLQYDTKGWKKYEQPLSQENMHRAGPKKPNGKYFVYTGNTRWGVQNLEYDVTNNLWFLAAYNGNKSNFANFSLFAVDGNTAAKKGKLEGVEYIKKGKLLSLAQFGNIDPNNPSIRGWHFDRPTTGIAALGDNYFYISHRKRVKPFQSCNAVLYRFTGNAKSGFERVK